MDGGLTKQDFKSIVLNMLRAKGNHGQRTKGNQENDVPVSEDQ